MKKALITIMAVLITSLSFAQLNPLIIGTINPGDSIVIYYDVTINTGCGCTRIANQGTVSGSNFASLFTNDPDTPEPGDSTRTFINSNILPLALQEFSAVPKAPGIQLSWKVSFESDLLKYEVERSTDGRQFQKIGEVASLNIAAGFTYSFFDPFPNSGVNFYRLKIVERSAASKYSGIVTVDINGKHGGISVYPNPVIQQQITLQLTNILKGKYQVLLFNAVGQIVYRKDILHEGGSSTALIKLPAFLAQGMYILQLKGGEINMQKSLLVK